MTILSNFTYGRALGTSPSLNTTVRTRSSMPSTTHANYGPSNFDYKYLYNFAASYKTPWFKSQKGIIGHVVGGFTICPALLRAERRAGLRRLCRRSRRTRLSGSPSSSSISGPNYSTGDCAQTIVPGNEDSVDALVESGFERSWHQ